MSSQVVLLCSQSIGSVTQIGRIVSECCVHFPFMWGSISHTCGLCHAMFSVNLPLSFTCSSNLSSLSVGTKSGYKLFPLSSIERLEPSFEKGKDEPPCQIGPIFILCANTAVGLLSCSIECIPVCHTLYTTDGHGSNIWPYTA